MDLLSLQRFLGHSSLERVRTYAQQSQNDLKEAHRRAGPVDALL
jgi:site-specific recombinase XerD